MSQRVLITGGGSGIGRRLAERGDRIALCDTDPAAIAETQGALPEAITQVADVSDEAQMHGFLSTVEAKLGGIDVVCANAGTGGPAGRIEDLSFDAWQDCVAVNLHGAFLTCRWAARVMRARGQGAIVITSSTSGQWGHPFRAPYAAAKWALLGLTKTLAMELGPDGIRVNAICPGAVDGPRMERVLAKEAAASGRDPEEIRQQYARGTSLRSWVTADDLADTVLFLASPAAAKISGQFLAVDGHTETNAP